jgi:hypothetical protein
MDEIQQLFHEGGWPSVDNSFGQATLPAGTFTQMSAGGGHTCGVKSDGTVAC